MRKPQEYNLDRDGITHSILSSWLTCRQQCRYSLDGWTSVRPKEAMSFGSIFHNMLRALYDHFRTSKAPKTLKGLIKSAQKRIDPWIDTYVSQHSRLTPSADYVNMLEKQAALCEAILPLYLTQWEDDFRSREWADLESEFDVVHKTPSGDFRLRGKRDGVFRKKKQKGVWILETKTKSRIDSDLVDSLAVDSQNLHYMWATYLELGEMPVGVDFNVVRRPGMDQRQGESHSDYAERVAADIQKRPESYFVRMEIAHTTNDVELYAKQLNQKLAEFQTWSEDMDAFTYRNEGACVGRWSCEFLSACASGNMKGYLRQGLFRELGS